MFISTALDNWSNGTISNRNDRRLVMSRPSKKPKYKLDPKKFESEPEKQKKEQDWSGDDIFKEMLREKSRHRH